MTGEELLRAVGGIDDELIAETGVRLGVLSAAERTGVSTLDFSQEAEMNTTKIRSFRRTALIAAAVAAALAITALAAVVFRTRVQPADGLEGTWGDSVSGNHTTYFENAKLYMTFESDAPRHEIAFKANWLPSEPTWGTPGEYTDYLSDDGEGAVLPYVINSYNRIDIQGIRYCFDGKETLVRQDMWNGYERTEVTLDYSGTPHAFRTANYLILFQPEDNFLIYIGGTDPMETLEKIAENLDVRVGAEITELYDAGSDIAWFDLGRG